MNINNFKNQLAQGGARANLFRVNGTFPAAAVAAAGLNPSDNIQFLCHATSIPAINVGTCQVFFQGRALKMAGDREFPEWNIQVLNDSTFGLRNAFEKWSDVMNRIESNVSRNGLAEYAQTWTVTHLDRTGKDVKSYKFVDCWPSSVGEIALTFEQQTTVESFPVTLQYQYYESQGTSS